VVLFTIHKGNLDCHFGDGGDAQGDHLASKAGAGARPSYHAASFVAASLIDSSMRDV
jgi:hypothetical protein